jgi:NAD(P)-dependent dehydrogenase (short-subunit alcohol dehydrogenase family)
MGSRTTSRVLITGGSGGLGIAVGALFAESGGHVGVLARSASRVESAAARIRALGGRATALVADVLDAPALERAVDRFADEAGGIDCVVLAAGRLRAIGPMDCVDFESWWLDLETTLRGASRTIRAALPRLRESATPSVIALVGPGLNGELAFASGYAAAQAGLARLIESLDREWSQGFARIYGVNPGLVPTEFLAPLLDSPEGRRWLPRFNEALAEGKEVGPDCAAEMVVWLARERPAALSGRIVPALLSPSFLESRLSKIADEGLNVLRLR